MLFLKLLFEVVNHGLNYSAKESFGKKVEGELRITSVDIVLISLDPYHVFVEGYIMSDRVFVGVVDFYEFNREKYSQLMKL